MTIESQIIKSKLESAQSEDYEFFKDDIERSQLFEYCKAIAEYLKTEAIPNLVIIDRSARPLYIGVMEYLRTKYPQEEMPNIYFMNPKGFKAKEELTPKDIDDIAEASRLSFDIEEGPEKIKSKEGILKEFQNTYQRLLADKEKPVLIFDSCLHTGKSIGPVKEALEKNGFSDVRIGTVNPTDSESNIKSDFYITPTEPAKHCHPFDRDGMIEKTFEHVYSKRTKDPERRKRAIQLREEIKRIMQGYLEDEPL